MSYTTINFKTKKELKLALSEGQEVRCYNPGLGGDLSNFTGVVYLEGPHYPKPHKWYASGKMEGGILKEVK
jgi:hypothetical protein